MMEGLTGKFKALSSNTSIAKKKNKLGWVCWLMFIIGATQKVNMGKNSLRLHLYQ
jgi:hypothetical protein